MLSPSATAFQVTACAGFWVYVAVATKREVERGEHERRRRERRATERKRDNNI